MKRLSPLLAVTIAGLLFQTGCGKKAANTGPTPPPTSLPKAPATEAPAPDAAPPPPPSAASAPATEAGPAKEEAVDPDALKTVTTALQSYMIAKGVAPKTLDELVAAKFLRSVPAPPPGKKFAYDPVHLNISLVNQ